MARSRIGAETGSVVHKAPSLLYLPRHVTSSLSSQCRKRSLKYYEVARVLNRAYPHHHWFPFHAPSPHAGLAPFNGRRLSSERRGKVMKQIRVVIAVMGLTLMALALNFTAGRASGDNNDQPGRIQDPIPGHIRQGPIRAQLQGIAYGSGLTAPLYGTFAPGPGPKPGDTTTQPNILYVVDQDGPLWAVDVRTGAKRLFINTRTQRPLIPLGAFGPGTFDERGFLGVAFHPDYQLVGSPGFGKFYTYTSELPGTNADAPPNDHFNVVTEWQAADPLTAPPVHPASEQNANDRPPPEEAEPPLA